MSGHHLWRNGSIQSMTLPSEGLYQHVDVSSIAIDIGYYMYCRGGCTRIKQRNLIAFHLLLLLTAMPPLERLLPCRPQL